MRLIIPVLCLAAGLCTAALPATTARMPLEEVRPGMRGVGLTVFEGSRREEFGAEVLGVLRNVMGPRRNVIVARLSGGPLAETGVIQGMSGSPVYVDDKADRGGLLCARLLPQGTDRRHYPDRRDGGVGRQPQRGRAAGDVAAGVSGDAGRRAGGDRRGVRRRAAVRPATRSRARARPAAGGGPAAGHHAAAHRHTGGAQRIRSARPRAVDRCVPGQRLRDRRRRRPAPAPAGRRAPAAGRSDRGRRSCRAT